MFEIPFFSNTIFYWFKRESYDDLNDRLNYFVTSTLLGLFTIMISAKQYVGTPIQCWMPMEFKGGWEQYAEDYCFIQNTFFVPFHEEIPGDVDERTEAEIGYYQWVPIALAIQSILFYLPNFLWRTLHKQTGLDILAAVQDAAKIREHYGEQRKTRIQEVASYLKEMLNVNQESISPARCMCFRFGSSLGSYVTMLHLFVKFLYLVNVLGQFFFLNRFLGNDYALWGWDTFSDLWNGREWTESGVFPRVTLCDFKVRRLANIHRYTVQCVLMINMFNEKIYLFIWFWFVFVAVSTFINFIYTMLRTVPTSSRERMMRSWTSIGRAGADEVDQYMQHDYSQDRCLKKFTHNALRADGVLLLRFIEGHVGSVVTRDIAKAMFKEYLESKSLNQDPAGYLSTKSSSPGLVDDGPHENLYVPEKRGLMAPDYPTKHD